MLQIRELLAVAIAFTLKLFTLFTLTGSAMSMINRDDNIKMEHGELFAVM
jgi:hypothetical protein